MFGLTTYWIFLAGLAVGAWLRPPIAIAAILCLYGLKQWGQSTTEFLSQHREITNYAVALIALMGVTLAAVKRSCVFCRVPTIATLVGLLYLYALLSIAWAPDTRNSLDQWMTQGPYIVTVILVAPLLLTSTTDLRIAFIATLIAGSSISLLTFRYGNWGFRGLLLYGDITGAETNPLAIASMAGTVLLIAGVLIARESSVALRLISLACIPITLAVILKSGSRGQLISSAVGLLAASSIAFRLKSVRSFAAFVFVGALIVGLGYWGSTLVDVDTARWSSSDTVGSVAGRLSLAKALLIASSSHPLTMIFGLGNSSALTLLSIYPHIAGLEVVAEEGIIGAALYFTIIVMAFRSIIRLAVAFDNTATDRQVIATLTGLFVFELLLSWKEGTLLSSVYVFAYAIILGRFELYMTDRRSKADDTAKSPRSHAALFANLMR